MTEETVIQMKEDIEVVNPMPIIARAEIESQIATAKEYPRNIAKFKDNLIAMACVDQETAEGCYYALPRSGKAIDGPSIRLAEIALACYGNCIAEADVVGEDNKYVYAMGQCRDLEHNTAVRIKVRRRITDKNGKKYNDDMVAVTANAAIAIALRNAIFKIVPAAYIKPVFEKVKETAVGNAESLANRRAEVIKRLTKFGLTEERILSVISRNSIDEVTFNDVAVLIGLGTAIKDGDATVEEAFPIAYKDSIDKAVAGKKAASGTKKLDKTKKRGRPKKKEKESGAYHCNQCGKDFDEPAGQGENPLCRFCLSADIVETTTE